MLALRRWLGCRMELVFQQDCQVVISKKGQIKNQQQDKHTMAPLKQPNVLSKGNIYIFYA